MTRKDYDTYSIVSEIEDLCDNVYSDGYSDGQKESKEMAYVGEMLDSLYDCAGGKGIYDFVDSFKQNKPMHKLLMLILKANNL